RRDDDVVEREEAVVGLKRLAREDVQRGAGEATLTKHLVERVLVAERRARGVDEVRRRLQAREPGAGGEARRLRRDPRGERDGARWAGARAAGAARRGGGRRGVVGVGGEAARLDRREPRRDPATDGAEADEADREPAELRAGEPLVELEEIARALDLARTAAA